LIYDKGNIINYKCQDDYVDQLEKGQRYIKALEKNSLATYPQGNGIN